MTNHRPARAHASPHRSRRRAPRLSARTLTLICRRLFAPVPARSRPAREIAIQARRAESQWRAAGGRDA